MAPVFYAFRIMVGVGSLMLVVSAFAVWKLWCQRGRVRISLPRPLPWTLSARTFSGWVATLSGWHVTETGRQPFVVYGVLRTNEVVTSVPSPFIGATLVAYLLAYGLLLVTYMGVLRYMAENPVTHAPVPVTDTGLGKAGV